MRNEIYNAVAKAAKEAGFKHVDMWNRNVEFIDQEEVWPMPAVFVEFDAIEWQKSKERVFRTRSNVRLHIVTEWLPGSDKNRFEWSDKLRSALYGLSGVQFDNFELLQTMTNHDHEEIVEDVDVYSYRGIMGL